MSTSERRFLVVHQVVEVTGNIDAAIRALREGESAPHLDVRSYGTGTFGLRTMKPVNVELVDDSLDVLPRLKPTGNY